MRDRHAGLPSCCPVVLVSMHAARGADAQLMPLTQFLVQRPTLCKTLPLWPFLQESSRVVDDVECFLQSVANSPLLSAVLADAGTLERAFRMALQRAPDQQWVSWLRHIAMNCKLCCLLDCSA